jgi:hypothetical protein
MQRRTAIAAASAISISLFSGMVAVGAHLGALGFAGTASGSAAQPVAAVTAPAPAANQSTTTVAQHGRDHADTTDDGHGEHDDEHATSQPATQNASTTIGHHDD